MKKTDYCSIAKKIVSKCSFKEYNNWLKLSESRLYTDRDYYLLFTGMRIGRGVEDQRAYEELQKRLPMSDEEYEYYANVRK